MPPRSRRGRKGWQQKSTSEAASPQEPADTGSHCPEPPPAAAEEAEATSPEEQLPGGAAEPAAEEAEEGPAAPAAFSAGTGESGEGAGADEEASAPPAAAVQPLPEEEGTTFDAPIPPEDPFLMRPPPAALPSDEPREAPSPEPGPEPVDEGCTGASSAEAAAGEADAPPPAAAAAAPASAPDASASSSAHHPGSDAVTEVEAKADSGASGRPVADSATSDGAEATGKSIDDDGAAPAQVEAEADSGAGRPVTEPAASDGAQATAGKSSGDDGAAPAQAPPSPQLALPPSSLYPAEGGMGGTGESADDPGTSIVAEGDGDGADGEGQPAAPAPRKEQPPASVRECATEVEAPEEPGVSGDYTWRSPDDGKEGLLRLHAGGQWWHAVHRTSTERGRVVTSSTRRTPSNQAVNIARAYKDFDYVGRDAGDSQRVLQQFAGEYQDLQVWETAEALGKYRLLRNGGHWALVLHCEHCSWRANFPTAPLELRPAEEGRTKVEGMIDSEQLVLCYAVDEDSRQLKLLLNLDAVVAAVEPPASAPPQASAQAEADSAPRGDGDGDAEARCGGGGLGSSGSTGDEAAAPAPCAEPGGAELGEKRPGALLPRHALLRSVQAAFQHLGFARTYDWQERGVTFSAASASSSGDAVTAGVGAPPRSFDEDDDANWQ